MVRDMDLVRALLLHVEQHASLYQAARQPNFESYTDEEVSYHLKLLHQAGLIEGRHLADGSWNIQALTWRGHDFLDEARDDTVWNKAKEKAGGTFNTLSLAVLGRLLSEVALQNLGLR